MHHKNIKLIIRKQLKKDCPYWRKPSKKEKKLWLSMSPNPLSTITISTMISSTSRLPLEELTGIENQIPGEDIIPLEYMDKLIDDFRNDSLIDATEIKRFHVHIKDNALKLIDGMLDNRIINHLLLYKEFTPEMRKFFPSHLLRASATFAQSVNLLVHVIRHFYRSGILKGGVLHAVDSAELFNDN